VLPTRRAARPPGILTGLAAADDMLFVPAGSKLVAY
jgi:hypothetical protein